MIVRYAASKVGLPNFKDYLILGDDIVIAGEKVALEYKRVILSLGVEISSRKSLGPSTRLGCEFASKLVLGRHDLRPLPVGLIVKRDLMSRARLIDVVAKRFHASHITSMRV